MEEMETLEVQPEVVAEGPEAAPEAVAQVPEEAAFLEHIRGLERQGELLRQQVPEFDLRAELQNPVFFRLTAPGMGIPLEDAYYAVHRKELQAAAERKMANAIRSGSLRPRENGRNNQAAAVTTFDYSKASKEQRNALKAFIRAEAAKGRKVYPGS